MPFQLLLKIIEKIQSLMGMMAIGAIIVLIIAIYYFFILKRNKTYVELINDQVLANQEHPPFSQKLCPLSHNGVEFGYSFWIFVEAWEHANYNELKPIMTRGDPDKANLSYLVQVCG